MKLQYQDQIDFLLAKANDMSDKLDEFVKHSGDAWHEMAKGIEQAFEDLSAACKSASSKFHS